MSAARRPWPGSWAARWWRSAGRWPSSAPPRSLPCWPPAPCRAGHAGRRPPRWPAADGPGRLADTAAAAGLRCHTRRRWARRAAGGRRGRSQWPHGAATRSVRSARRHRRTWWPRSGQCRVPAGTTGAYSSTTWSKIAHSAELLPAASSSGRCSSRRLAPRNSLATPWRTVITKVARGRRWSRRTRLPRHRRRIARAQDHQPHVLVEGLDLRPHVKGLRVLDRQFMQAEGVTDLGQLLFPWLKQIPATRSHPARIAPPPPASAPRLPPACDRPNSERSQWSSGNLLADSLAGIRYPAWPNPTRATKTAYSQRTESQRSRAPRNWTICVRPRTRPTLPPAAPSRQSLYGFLGSCRGAHAA